MKAVEAVALLLWLTLAPGLRVSAADAPWQTVLAAMPLPDGATLARSNAIRLIVSSFKSNSIVQALVVLPGVVDDFHLIHRDIPLRHATARNLADAMAALTNGTPVLVTFEDSQLLLHTASDRLGREMRVDHPASATRLREGRGLSGVHWVDTRWAAVHPQLRKTLGFGVQPDADSDEGGHFERLNLAAYGRSDWQMLQSIALATGTRVVVERRRVHFERSR